MTLSEKVIAAAQKRNTPGLYKDRYGNIWKVDRIRNLDSKEVTWRATIIFPWIVDEEQPA